MSEDDLYAKCRECGHIWLVVKTPMQLTKAAELMKRAACPMCGDTKPFAAAAPQRDGDGDG